MKKRTKIITVIIVGLCLFFQYLPIFVTIFFSFNKSKSLTKFTGFSLRWYDKMINNSSLIDAIWVSVSIAVIATVVSTAFGTITAIGISKSRKVVKEAILELNQMNILSPDVVIAISLMLLFAAFKVQKGYNTILLAHIIFCTPFVITNVLPKVKQLDPNLADAAMDLGATPFQALIKVIIPQIKPGIFAGALIAFTMSFDDFLISYFVTGNGVQNISIAVYNMTKRINPSINALSTVVVCVVMIVLLITYGLPYLKQRKEAK